MSLVKLKVEDSKLLTPRIGLGLVYSTHGLDWVGIFELNIIVFKVRILDIHGYPDIIRDEIFRIHQLYS